MHRKLSSDSSNASSTNGNDSDGGASSSRDGSGTSSSTASTSLDGSSSSPTAQVLTTDAAGLLRPQPGSAAAREAVQAAFKAGSLGFGFSAGGLLFPYYVGVVGVLQAAGVLRGAPLAGASAGSLIAAACNAGMPMSAVEESVAVFGQDCLEHGTRYRLGPLLRSFLHDVLPADAHERCSGSTYVAITKVVPYWRPWLVSHFESRDDLIEALLASCHIPWYLDGRWTTRFRGRFAMDGGLTNFIPTPPGVQCAVKVCCFPTWHLEAIRSRTAGWRQLSLVSELLDIGISPDTFEEWPYDYPQVIRWALQASTADTTARLVDKGRQDARAWLAATGLNELLEDRAQQQQQQQQPVWSQVPQQHAPGVLDSPRGPEGNTPLVVASAHDMHDSVIGSKRSRQEGEDDEGKHKAHVQQRRTEAEPGGDGGGRAVAPGPGVGLRDSAADVAACVAVGGQVAPGRSDSGELGG